MDLFITLIIAEIVGMLVFGLGLKFSAYNYALGTLIIAGLSALFAVAWTTFTWVSLGDMVPVNGGQASLVVLASINAALAWVTWVIHGGQHAATLRRR